ncbi:hypothetical protein J416_07807 [Gracilibacillus halophilus YIM-C55.5]|uniref:DUF2621 domain-containing protein n=1 Tax=Gracilibacillus halophilus YIM-C55.5 TaxID=1308866 RepID=N4WLB4_9BACI|nr:DUF2621 family protein [Gracilibacillus halophilus]ENH96967.1 hypothetical protein J416_07807 [Gracilibacillus halophilus YIM-C55.5]
MSTGFATFIILWTCILITLMAIGGFFMFRKFLKSLPKNDGHSILDWEKFYIEKSKHLWRESDKDFLEELISPVPELFRDVARQKIASQIGKLALDNNEKTITQDTFIQGYIMATPKRDHKFLRKKLKEKQIDITPYLAYFELSPKDYRNKKYAAKTNKS